MYLYKVTGSGAAVLECRDYGGLAEVPKELDGYPVTELLPYSFSEKRNPAERGGEKRTGGGVPAPGGRELPDLRGDRLTEIYLPGTLKKIGNYAFYNCGRLKTLHCQSTIEDIGSGVFTGCTGMSGLDIRIVSGRRSCLREILLELRQELYVNYSSEEGDARLIFPEFYEESVENTPAKKLSTQVHGCGHLYRNCFSQTDFSFKEYDSLFPFAVAQETEQMTVRMALWRLWEPLGLREEAGAAYRRYVKEHLRTAAEEALDGRGTEGISWLAETVASESGELDILLETASQRPDAAAVGWLMDYRRKRCPARAKRFSL